MKEKYKIIKKMSPTQLILSGYCLVILIGTLLLSLPIATKGPGATSISDSFFTATSATCVTGLIRFDTFTHWTVFGQLVILAMIQIGGIGFMSVAIMVLLLARKRITLSQRALMQNSISAPQIGGIVQMTQFIVGGTFLVEFVGAVLLSFAFVPMFGWGQGLYFSVFHSISAFCNAGFDLMGGRYGAFASLTGMSGLGYVNFVLMLLITVGGLGFFVWYDMGEKKGRFSRLNLQSKMVLTISTALILIGAAALFVLEYDSEAFRHLSLGEKVWASFFQSVSARTAGFNTVDLGALSEPGKFVMICLMYIGGSTGSTAGGMKTTTFWILCLSIFTTFFRKKNVEVFGRRMEENVTRTASCVFMIYILGTSISAVIVSAVEKVPMITALFETVSAMATVGSSFGLTPNVSMFTKLLLAFLMICGRVGSVTMLMVFSSEKKVISSRLPLDKVQIG